MQTFIAKTISGLEKVLAAEIAELGAGNIQILKRAVSFEGDMRMLYKANYCLRTAQRILMPVFSFELNNEDDLYDKIKAYEWEKHLTLQKTLAVDANVSDSEFTHSHFVALRTKDAIVDRFREISNGRRPSVDIENPHIRINIHIYNNKCDVSLDSSGASLHKRGYRVSNAEAPMSEVLAAGLIRLSGWKRDSHFVDPMCGSGTLLIEAAMFANNFPAGMYRKEFGFMHWPGFDENLWKEVTDEALAAQTEFEYQIIGSDISPQNLAACRANLKSARLHKDVKIFVSPMAAIQAPQGKPGIMIINPPYGERIKLGDIIGLYRSIGDVLKQEFSGYQAWVISSDQKALSFIGLKPSIKHTVFNGQLECRFVNYDMYKGSKRGRYMQNEENQPDRLFLRDAEKRQERHIQKSGLKKEKHDARRDSGSKRKEQEGNRFDRKRPDPDQTFRKNDKPFIRNSDNKEKSKEKKFDKKPVNETPDKEPFWKRFTKDNKQMTENPAPQQEQFIPRTKPANGKTPSESSKFSSYRDYEIKRRPRKDKKEQPKPLPPTKSDDLED